jgi:hypothetical protein
MYNHTSPTDPSSAKIIENFCVNHGGRRICHSTIAHGAAAPQPSTSTSSPHHGRRRLRLIWAQSIVGVSTMHHSTQRYIVTDKTPQIWLPPTTIAAFHHFPPPFRRAETTVKVVRWVTTSYCWPKLAAGSCRNQQTQAWRVDDASCHYLSSY